MGWLEGSVALVTGGGSGLGRAIVERFLDEGASVVVLEHVKEKCDKLEADFPSGLATVHGDVTSLADNQRAVAAAVTTFGKLDTLVGVAGVWDGNVPLIDLPDDKIVETFDILFDVNVKGYVLGAKAACRELQKTRGSMIFTLSNAAFHADGGGVLYTATKHAGIGIVRQLAFELAPQVRVNAVAPGPLNSDLRGPSSLGLDQASLTADRDPAVISSLVPLDFSPTADDYTGLYVLFASGDNSRTATGAVLQADGGLGIRGIARNNGSQAMQVPV